MIESKLTVIKYFIGIDVSKATFNYCLRYAGGPVLNGKVANNVESIKEFILTLKEIPGFKLGYTVFGMEVTGVYGLILIDTLTKMKAKVVVEPSMRIKNSLGIIRGKNDKLDAARIARYLIKNLQELKLWVPHRKIIDELSSLSTLRERMVKVGVIITTPLNEDINFVDPAISLTNINLCNPSIIQIEQLIRNIDIKIKALYTNDDHCNRLMKIMLSVMGIGEVTALQILIHTNEFKTIKTARTFASYCGVAPFEHDSGTSVKKRARVSPLANKRIKSLLHNGVRTCIGHDSGIKAYYRRRVDVDKKNKMSVMNAIKFKLICRVFACVRVDRFYEKGYVSVKPVTNKIAN
ncbi:transposase [Pedobacter agri]|uniref:Transposase n=2 Tax=Pedobacter agri TaxID=454586 RepID=A0A9X3I8P8_9SPHI|nr:transposase [Pedobacter agri]MCX3264956.1 transposase [Pedobacter agri]